MARTLAIGAHGGPGEDPRRAARTPRGGAPEGAEPV